MFCLSSTGRRVGYVGASGAGSRAAPPDWVSARFKTCKQFPSSFHTRSFIPCVFEKQLGARHAPRGAKPSYASSHSICLREALGARHVPRGGLREPRPARMLTSSDVRPGCAAIRQASQAALRVLSHIPDCCTSRDSPGQDGFQLPFWRSAPSRFFCKKARR